MQIIYLKLENFIGIWDGLQKTEIELDFSSCSICISVDAS